MSKWKLFLSQYFFQGILRENIWILKNGKILHHWKNYDNIYLQWYVTIIQQQQQQIGLETV